MSDPTSINDRLEAAAVKAEGASEIMRLFSNGPEGSYIPTESGLLPTIAEWLKLNEASLGDLPAIQAFIELLGTPAGSSEVGYRQSTVAEKLDFVFRPEDFGTIGVSVAGDTTAMQAAIDFAAPLNGAVVGKPGVNYQISSVRIKNGLRAFDFRQSLITPDASTAALTTGAIQLDGNGRFVTGTPVDNCYVAARMNMTNGGRCAIFADGCTNCDFSDSEIYGFTDHATINHYGILFWYGSNGNKVQHNKITGVNNPTQRGLLVDFIGQSDPWSNYFAGSGATTRSVNPCRHNRIANNELINGSYGVNLLGCENNTVTENICRGQNHRSIYLAESCAFNVIANNELLDFLSTAVLLGYGCIENLVVENICKREPGVQAAGTGEAVINVNTGARRNLIALNKIYADTNYGIYMGCNMLGNMVLQNEVRGYYIAGIALESDWEAIGDRPAGAIYSRPNYAAPGSISPGATQWSFANADSITIARNIIREGSPGRAVAGLYVAQVNSNSNLSILKCNIEDNEIFGNDDMAHYLYFFEETSGRLVNNKLSGNKFTDTSGIPSVSKIFMSRGRMHFNYQENNDLIDYVTTVFNDGDTTPSVAFGGSFAFNNSSPTLVTTFDDAPPGMEILVRLGANTTLVHNSSLLRSASGGDITGRSTNDWIVLRNASAGGTPLWIERDRSFSLALTGQATFDPASLVDGAGVTTSVTVTGAALGDLATVSFSLDLQGIMLTAYVSAANTVGVRFQNETGATIDLASGTLRARVMKQ
jgi:parallel beta-helix repeat protein